MKQRLLRLFCLLAVLACTATCRTNTDRTAGPVVLAFGQFNGVPTTVSVTAAQAAGGVQITSFSINSVIKDPTGQAAPLEEVLIDSYQVTYTRLDTGTRVPPPLVGTVSEPVPANGTGTLTNLPILLLAQLSNPPLSDLVKFGQDTQTGSAVILLNVQMQFFGATLSGDKVSSPVASFTMQFVP